MRVRSSHLAVLAISTMASLGSEGVRAQEAIAESIVDSDRPIRGPVRAIAGATYDRTLREGGSLSTQGVFVADVDGVIRFVSFREPITEATAIDIFDYQGEAWGVPLGMAFDDPFLFIYEGESRQLWSMDTQSSESPRPLELGLDFDRPTHLAVSPEGLLAVVDGDRLLFLEEGVPPHVYDRSRFPGAAGLAFSSWDTVHVLDEERGSVVTITFSRYKDGSIGFRSESDSVVARHEGEHLRAMTVRNGIVYVASDHRVFAMAGEQLLPVLPQSLHFDRILDLVVTASALYVLNDGDLVALPRLVPVDLVLEGLPTVSQSALIELYQQLSRRDLLPTKRVRARRTYDEMERLLFEEGVLIAPAIGPKPAVRVFEQKKRVSRLEAMGTAAKQELPRTTDQDLVNLERLLCHLNDGLCASGFPEGLNQEQDLVVPDLRIQRHFSRKVVYLERPLAAHLEELIPSADLRAHVTADSIRRLNPPLSALDDEALWEIKSGAATLPAESWSLTVAVPPDNQEVDSLDFWSLARRFPGVSWHSRAAFVTNSGRSARAQEPDDDGPVGDACAALRTRWHEWLSSINYPLRGSEQEPNRNELKSLRARIGVLEFKSTLLATHQVFLLDPDHPVWHSFNLLAELEPVPREASTTSAQELVKDAETYSPGAHHATHISALVAGRSGRCWSGLLPAARLVLIDLSDSTEVARTVNKAINEEVRVFNVSNTFSGPREDLRRTILEDDRALWVVAAGNDGKNLDTTDEASVPAPARWGWASNVSVVAALDQNGEVLTSILTPEGQIPGSNSGKHFVDLAAPGVNIVSASDQNRYGPATGTSQATPQVAAAAALLVDRLGERLEPGDAKARLIATASWRPTYKGKLWGGKLDFSAAVSHPDRNMIQTATAAARREHYAIVPRNDPKVRIRNLARLYDRSGETGDTAPETLRFSRVLSLRRNTDGTFRVVFREHRTDQLRIVLDADLSDSGDRLSCATYELLDPTQDTFVPSPNCESGISISQIQTYFQGGHFRIQWEDLP